MSEVYHEGVEQENTTVTPRTEFESSTRANRTNRLEVLEEYYGNATNADHIEATTAVELKEIVILSANASVDGDRNGTNLTIVEEIGERKIKNLNCL